MKFLLVVFLALQLGTASTWSMDCDHYWAAVERLNQDPFIKRKRTLQCVGMFCACIGPGLQTTVTNNMFSLEYFHG